MKISDLRIGMTYSLERVFSDKDVEMFAGLSLDTNPLHLDEVYASNHFFGARIVPGFLSASLFSAIIGTKMPGIGSIYLSQNMRFLKPIYLGQKVTAVVTVVNVDYEKERVSLSTVCEAENHEILIDGSAIVKIA